MKEIFELALQKTGDTSLYQQLAEGIERLITAGRLPANSKLPSIRKLAEHFGVNAVTVVTAYKTLEKKQMVYSRKGSGTFVSPLPVERIPSPMASRSLRSFERELSLENAINFAAASLPHELFPVDDFKKAFDEVLEREKGGAFRYMDSMGYAPLDSSFAGIFPGWVSRPPWKMCRLSPAPSRALILFLRPCWAMGTWFLWKSPRFTVRQVPSFPVAESWWKSPWRRTVWI